jgi:molybdopterin-guanine dinucleotide biosynthesis protein A
MSIPVLFGLVLAGGASTRMKRDKAALDYHGKPQLHWAFEQVAEFCAATFVSVRPDQTNDPLRAELPQIVDRRPGAGPLAGIEAALHTHPKAAWLVVACDLPQLTPTVLKHLVEHRDPPRMATAYRSNFDGLPEPLCAIWEPSSRAAIAEWLAKGKECPRKLLINSDVALIDLPVATALDNVNTPEEFDAVRAGLRSFAPAAVHEHRDSNAQPIHVQYFAVFREQAGRSEETITTHASTPAALYAELRQRHPFKLAQQQVKVAVNDEFASWDTPLRAGDRVVFIPPVAGG